MDLELVAGGRLDEGIDERDAEAEQSVEERTRVARGDGGAGLALACNRNIGHWVREGGVRV